MRIAAILEAGRQDFLAACSGITDADAAKRLQASSWTVLEIIEHVTLVEERYLRWIEQGDTGAPPPDADKEMRIFMMIRNRDQQREAPDAMWPTGRFLAISEATAAFNEIRNRALAMAGEALYSLAAEHPFFGRLNGAEWMQLIDGHARRHADQIRDLTGR
jgi:hypothetical protein